MSKGRPSYQIICDSPGYDTHIMSVGYFGRLGMDYILTYPNDEDVIRLKKSDIYGCKGACLGVMRLLRDAYRSLKDEEGVSNFRIAGIFSDGSIKETGIVADPEW